MRSWALCMTLKQLLHPQARRIADGRKLFDASDQALQRAQASWQATVAAAQAADEAWMRIPGPAARHPLPLPGEWLWLPGTQPVGSVTSCQMSSNVMVICALAHTSCSRVFI